MAQTRLCPGIIRSCGLSTVRLRRVDVELSPPKIFSISAAAGMRIFDVNGDGPYEVGEFESPPPMVWTFVAR